jgi:asparagine synthase (glutamine-hydrolysing)
MLLATPDFYNASTDTKEPAPEILAPLYSQPVIELLLRIPIHVHFEEGRDRGLARRAFAQEVPQPILQRHWKDRAPGFHDELIHRNLDFLRELFLDGVLVNKGLLDRAAVERALSTAPTKSEVFPGEIINHMGTEIWARQWMSSAQRRAVA